MLVEFSFHFFPFSASQDEGFVMHTYTVTSLLYLNLGYSARWKWLCNLLAEGAAEANKS